MTDDDPDQLLMRDLRRAIADGLVVLVHQPKLNFHTRAIDGVECLVRWRHPTLGQIDPELFVPMAEETDNIRALTDWVLKRAIDDQRALAEAGWPLIMSVNISARLLGDNNFADSAVAAAAQASGKLCFEITETAAIDDAEAAVANIERFIRSGVAIAIDDYGAGSSLAHLRLLPAHELKIDKMFVQNLTSSQPDALLVRSTIDLAHSLGLKATAEGVETPAAFALLASMGCDMAQGHLISRPLTMDELIPVLTAAQSADYLKATLSGNP